MNEQLTTMNNSKDKRKQRKRNKSKENTKNRQKVFNKDTTPPM